MPHSSRGGGDGGAGGALHPLKFGLGVHAPPKNLQNFSDFIDADR